YEFAKKTEDYRLSLGKLKPGKYSWVATTSFDGKRYSKSGIFVVTDISLEKIESKANHNVLSQIAKKSNGEFYSLKNSSRLISDIKERKDITSLSYEESTFKELIDYTWLFFLIVILLGAEWFIRRRLGSY
ncbi:MAG: hypothetical protein MK066_06900, partial [Crocinitomicaceae bacterium]|nr:hypothetical protein [Crocinitomicaceae bacterium]